MTSLPKDHLHQKYQFQNISIQYLRINPNQQYKHILLIIILTDINCLSQYSKMEPENTYKTARVLKLTPNPLIFYLKDQKNKSCLALQIQSSQQTLSGYYHLLKDIVESVVQYQIIKSEENNKGNIFLNGKNILQMFDNVNTASSIKQCVDEKVYEKDEIIQCYVMKVQCLKLKLYLLEQKSFITFYFTEFRLPKINNSHPKEIWHICQEYYNREILGDFVQVQINGSETYRDELNIHGEICRLCNGNDLKEQFLGEGYADLSKNCENYLSKGKISQYEKIVKEAKSQRNGVWSKEIVVSKKANPIFQEEKISKWEQWNKKKLKFTDLKNGDQEVREMITELRMNSGAKADPHKNKIILEAAVGIFDGCLNDKVLGYMDEILKICSNILGNLQFSIGLQAQNLDFLKYLNRVLIFLIFHVEQNESLALKNKNKINKSVSSELEKCIKVIFKCCFLGNQTFHKKVFHKHVESDFERFSYDPAYLSGISSYSEVSDLEETDKTNKASKLLKKIATGQAKIRMNSTLLLSHIFKNFQNIVENHWEMCVKSNVLTQDFITYLSKLKITPDPTKMTDEQKKNIAALMRTNFGDYSLILLVFFQQNAKIKTNAINCFINMISNFQGKKMIDTTEAVYIEKLLKQTKSSYIPKSYIIFSGLRNALYFMLFSLHHEKNIIIIMKTFKALTQLCQQSTLIDKMGFMDGMGLLLSNYIVPVLNFPWEMIQLAQLKSLCVEFLGALVNSQKKWEQVEIEYLMKPNKENINYGMLEFIKNKKDDRKEQTDRVIAQITKYFMKMAKRYYSAIFYEIHPGFSIWSVITEFYINHPSISFTNFLEQIFKCHFDNLTLMKSQSLISRKVVETVDKAEKEFDHFLEIFFPKYAQMVTNENYISLINILTYVSYEKWDLQNYAITKSFLLHCFDSVTRTSNNKQYPSIDSIKNNSLVRLALIKLLGYISFCKAFQKKEYSTLAMKSLLKYSKQFKSLNSIVKITWGISNWCNIECFKDGMTEEELKQCLTYMIQHSHSDKQKIASNCTRGIGFFVKNFYKEFNIDECKDAVIKNLSHQILKVRINSTKTLRSLLTAEIPIKNYEEFVTVLEQNALKNNYHLQTETLLFIKQLGSPIKPDKMISIYGHILKDLCSHTTMEYEFSEIKTLKQLRRNIIEEITKMDSNQFLKNNEMATRQFYNAVENFIIDERQQSLRKKAEESEILERGFQKGEEAENTVFNIKKEKYDEEKTISTQFTLSSFQYEINNENDLELLEKIKQLASEMRSRGEQWEYLSKMVITGKKISLGQV